MAESTLSQAGAFIGVVESETLPKDTTSFSFAEVVRDSANYNADIPSAAFGRIDTLFHSCARLSFLAREKESKSSIHKAWQMWHYDAPFLPQY